MFSESKHGEQDFKTDWKEVFERDYCNVCTNRQFCPINWKCRTMTQFIKDMEKE